ncbi:MAG: nuclease-related domain-containing protein [Microbacterium sp.]
MRAPPAPRHGASTKRRRDNRERSIRRKHPKLGGLILALSDEPQSTRAWERGAIGEEMLAARLKDLPEPARVLNDRRLPGTRANIDHIVVAPSGVWVVDAKRYRAKRPTLRVEGGIIRPRAEPAHRRPRGHQARRPRAQAAVARERGRRSQAVRSVR